MSVLQHGLPIPDEDELAQLVGAATPHFAFQARDRVAAYAAALPPDHPRQAELTAHLEHLDRLGYEGESAGVETPDLPARPSVPALRGGAASREASEDARGGPVPRPAMPVSA